MSQAHLIETIGHYRIYKIAGDEGAAPVLVQNRRERADREYFGTLAAAEDYARGYSDLVDCLESLI